MRIMGVDVGLTSPGFSCVDTAPGHKPGRVLFAECYIPEVNKEDLSTTAFDTARITLIVTRLFSLIRQYQPHVIVAELPTGGAKSASAIKGMAISTSYSAAVIAALRYFEPSYNFEYVQITPLQNKKGSQGDTKRKRTKIEYEQTKWNVFNAVDTLWPGIDWPRKRKSFELNDSLCFAMADSLSCVATYLRRHGGLG